MKLRFNQCLLDLEARTLACCGRDVHLAPKAFEVLKLLVENRPRALSKAELITRVWPEVFVADDSLAKVVSKLRTAIGDTDDAPVVRTVHGFGYAFVAIVESGDASAEAFPKRAVCWMFCGQREFALTDGEHVIGREANATICLDSPNVSRHHAKVTVNGTDATVEDLGSKNGLFVSGVRVEGQTQLTSGDEVSIGPFRLRFHVASASGSTRTEMA